MSVDPSTAPYRPAFVRGTDGLYYRVGGSGGGGGSGLVIQDEGISLAARTGLNFIGPSVTVTDDSANNRTNVTIASAVTVQEEGTALTSRSTLNFIGANVTATDDSANNRTNVTITSVGGIDQTTADGLYVNVTGDNMSGNINLTAPSGTARSVMLSTGAVATAGTARWALSRNNTAESGSNSGSNFVLSRYSDTGVWIADSITVARNDGQIALSGPVPTLATTTPTLDAHIASKLYVDSGNTTRVKTTGGTITGPVAFTNGDSLITPLSINRTQAASATTDADTFVVNYLGERSTWTNEKGNLRTSNRKSPAEDAFKLIGAAAITGNYLIVMKDDGTSLLRVGSAGNLIVEYGFRLSATAASPGAGKVLTSDASGNGTWQSPSGGLQARSTTSITTTSLAANATQKTTITLANGYQLYRITCSAASRVRLYSTTAKRDADETRIIGNFPGGNHGLVLEYLAAAGLLGQDITPTISGFDGATTPTGAIPITITNTGTTATTITVTFDWVRTE